MEKKVTKKEMFGEVIALAEANGRQDIVDFANREIEPNIFMDKLEKYVCDKITKVKGIYIRK